MLIKVIENLIRAFSAIWHASVFLNEPTVGSSMITSLNNFTCAVFLTIVKTLEN